MSEVVRKIPVSFEKIKDYQVKDTRFTKVKIFVLHTGLNLNNSVFTKEAVEEAIPSIFNTAILGFIEDNDNGDADFSDHRMGLEIKDEKIKVTYKGHAYGVIPESCNPRWEEKVCDDGVTRTFLVVDGLLWNKFDCAKEIYDRDLFKDQSMELSEQYTGAFDKDGHFVFEKFYFDGCCALSNGVQPAMTGASIEVNFALDEIKTKLEQFNAYYNNQPSNDVDDIDNSEKGGNTLAEEIKNEEVVENIEETDVQETVVEEVVENEVEPVVEETPTDENVNDDESESSESEEPTELEVDEETEPVENPTETEVEPETETEFSNETEVETEVVFSTTYRQKREALQNALTGSVEKDENGNVVSGVDYWVSDFDDTYVYVEKYTWGNGDSDTENGRFSYSFDDSTITATISGEFEKMIVTWVTVEENERLNAERTEYARLVQFEQNVLTEKRNNDVKEIFDKFEDKLTDVEAYSKLKENCADMSLEDIEDKCFAMVGKIATKFSTKKKNDSVVKLEFEVSDEGTVDDGYGGILSSKYNK